MDRVIVFSHEDEFLFELSESDVYELRRHEEINGEHYLTITTTTVLQKEQRILTQNATGKWYEWVVTTEDMEHAGGSYMVGTYMAVWSLQHDLSTVPVSVMPGTGGVLVSAEQALTSLLSTTGRWGVGTVTVTTVGSASMYRTLVWDGLATLIATWGGEVDAEITVDNMKVTSRAVSLWAYQGSTEATRRFDYGADMTSIKRRVESDPFACRIIPLGKGEETEGGYGRKITIEEVNDGKDYLQNDSVVAYVRRPAASGYEYPTIYAENSEIDSPAELKAWGESVLESLTGPKVTYEATVLQLSQAGMDAYGIAIGDLVQCVDRKFTAEGLRVSGRVTCIDANLLDPSDTQVTIGYLSKSLSAAMQQALSSLDSRIDTAVAMSEGVAGLSQEYVQRILDRLNEEINLTGGYFYITDGWGVRTYDTAVSDPLVGTEASQVVEIRGGNIRIANSRTSSGDWDWKTVIQSGHLAIDLITAARLISGYIGSPSGNYWNLDTGEFRLAATASLGGKTVQEVLSAYNGTITGVDVEYAQSTSSTSAPLTGWSTTAPAYEAGKYIWSRTKTTTPNGNSYSTPVMISGRDGVDGSQGEAGVGITSIVEQYYLSTSNATQTGGSWSTDQPAWSSGHYIWTRSLITWDTTPATTTTTTPVLAKALNGANEAAAQAQGSVDAISTQQAIFNLLTNNGALQGLFMQNNQLYINSSYVQSGILKLGGANNINGTLIVYDASGNQVGKMDNTGLDIVGAVTLLYTITQGSVWVDAALNTDSHQFDTSTGVISGSTQYGLSINYHYGYQGGIVTGLYLLAQQHAALIGSNQDILIQSGLGNANYGNYISLGAASLIAQSYTADKSKYAEMRLSSSGAQASLAANNGSSETKLQVIYSGVTVQGSFYVTGTKNRLVSTEHYGDRVLYCDETTSPMFTDVGSGIIGPDGLCYVEIDDVFSETARTDLSYQVFLQKCGRGDLWVSEKHSNYFVVEGDPNLRFDWQLKARQRDYENTRIEDHGLDETVAEDNPVAIASEPISAYDDDMRYVELLESIYANELA